MLPVFDLDPVVTATDAVGPFSMLRDQSFKSHSACGIEQVRADLPGLKGRNEDALRPPAKELHQVCLAHISTQSQAVEGVELDIMLQTPGYDQRNQTLRTQLLSQPRIGSVFRER